MIHFYGKWGPLCSLGLAAFLRRVGFVSGWFPYSEHYLSVNLKSQCCCCCNSVMLLLLSFFCSFRSIWKSAVLFFGAHAQHISQISAHSERPRPTMAMADFLSPLHCIHTHTCTHTHADTICGAARKQQPPLNNGRRALRCALRPTHTNTRVCVCVYRRFKRRRVDVWWPYLVYWLDHFGSNQQHMYIYTTPA